MMLKEEIIVTSLENRDRGSAYKNCNINVK